MRSIAPGLRSVLDAHASSDSAPVKLEHAPPLEPDMTKYIVIHRLSTENYTTLDAPDDDSLRAETFRIVTCAKTDEEAHTTADAMAEYLDDYSGAMGSSRVCEAVFIEDESGDYDPPLYVEGWASADLTVTIQHSPA